MTLSELLRDNPGSAKAAVKAGFINKEYESKRIYSGRNSYHTSQRSDFYFNEPKRSKSSYLLGIELEMEAIGSESFRKIVNTPSNIFFYEKDSSLSDCYGIEMITVPLLPAHATSAEFWSKPCEFLAEHARAWKKSNCGLHVHLSRSFFGIDRETQEKNISKMFLLWSLVMEQSDFARKVYGREATYSEHRMKGQKATAAETLFGNVKNAMRNKAVKKVLVDESDVRQGGRYMQINTQPAETVEFRLGKASINPRRISAIVHCCLLFAKWSKRVSLENADLEAFRTYVKANAKKSGLADFVSNFDETGN